MEKDKNTPFNNYSDPMDLENSNQKTEKTPASRILWRILILGAVLVVLIALSIGIIKLVPQALSSLASVNVSISSLFSPKEKVSVTLDKSKINSGDSFNVSWKHTGGTVDGYFTLSTTCQNNYHLEYPVGNTRNVVDCNHTIQINASTTSITLIGVNTSSATITAPISINFVSKNTNKIVVTGASSVVINSASSSTPTTDYNNDQTATSSTPSQTSNDNPYGNNGSTTSSSPGDLVVRITAIGIQDPTTGAFVQTSNVNTNNRVIMKFEVENIGSGSSGTWNLTANLPAVNVSDQTKYISNQKSIPAGLAVSGELYFDYVQTGQNRIVSLKVSTNQPEIRTDNNQAQISITATGNNYNGGGITTNGIDLSVRILDTGIVDRSTGQYSATTFVRASDRAGVRFQVTNSGSSPSGVWSFTASLPNGNGIYNNNSGAGVNQNGQTSLAPGETRVYIIGFDGLQYGSNNTATVNVDPYGQTADFNRSNNSASANIYVSSY